MARHVPRRRCVGCGRVAPKPELVRFAAVPSAAGSWSATLDRAGTLPGRGAYLCRDAAGREPNGQCLRLATQRGGLQRTLRRAVVVPQQPTSAGPLESESR
ncbi:MAG TPA: YlxR family protein [Solirubrobacteraceae bacterium]|nr:YlxR family protein [Solirubrobacteraceae bacterium]